MFPSKSLLVPCVYPGASAPLWVIYGGAVWHGGRERNIWRTDALLKRYDGILVFNTGCCRWKWRSCKPRWDLMERKLHLVRVSTRIKIFFNYLKELLEDTQISFSCIHLTLQPIISSFTRARLMQNVTLCENVRCTVILQPVLIKISRWK